VHHPLHTQFIRLALIVGIIAVESENQALVQLDPVTREILKGSSTSQP
jgi:hypothetical protein